MTPLYISAGGDHVEVVKLLLSQRDIKVNDRVIFKFKF